MTSSHRLAVAALVLAGTAVLGARQTQTPPKPVPADPHAQMNMRGAEVMGFDQNKTVHHFYLYADGGAIDVSVKDAADKTDLDAIRSHLPHIAMMFGMGDFSAPMMVHSTNVPGTKELAARKDQIAFKYLETPKGGRVDIVTHDKAALEALYEFLRYQITDHKTNDAMTVSKR